MAIQQSVKIPVDFSPVEGSVKQLQSIIESLKSDTALTRSLTRSVDTVTQRINKLKRISEGGIFSEAQFRNFQNSAEATLDYIQAAFSRAKNNMTFNDLVLSGDQEAMLIGLQKREANAQVRKSNFESDYANQLREQFKQTADYKKIIGLIGEETIGGSSVKAITNMLSSKTIGVTGKLSSLTKQAQDEQKEIARINSLLGNGNLSTFKTTLQNQMKIGDNWDSGIVGVGRLKERGKILKNGAFSNFTDEEIYSKIIGNGFSEKDIKDAAARYYGETGPSLSSRMASLSGKQSEINEITQQLGALKQAYSFFEQGASVKGLSFDRITAEAESAKAAINSFKESAVSTQKIKLASNFESGLNGLNTQLLKVRATIPSVNSEISKLNQSIRNTEMIQMTFARWMSFYQVLNLTRRAIKHIYNDIKELDSVMTQISVVTQMSQDDLWGQISKYTALAQQYGTSVKGVYQVSQIFYQQGLQTASVMQMTTETLKLAKIAGLDYSKAADYMTVAVRAFNIEMSNAQKVTDVYSALAATTASNTEEIATAMSKTASSAASVGSSLENTSAMIATMIANTREGAENIGSALKSIISRYGSLKTDPTSLVDADGEAVSYNDVDAALQSVGITLKDTSGQFRNFDEVILELAQKWDTLDTLSQRYIATQMAGNR